MIPYINSEKRNNTLLNDLSYLDIDYRNANISDIFDKYLLNSKKIKFKQRATQLLKESIYDYGFSSEAEVYIQEHLEENGIYCREWLNEIYLENINDESMIVALLRVISHFEYDEVFPVGMTIASAALGLKSNLVKENAIRAFENWEDPRNIKLLEMVDCTDYLKPYLEQVIQDLRDLL